MQEVEWLEERRTGVTGTDIAAIVGLSPWRTPLDVYHDKTTKAPPSQENSNMLWGKLQEGIIADYYAHTHGVTLENPGLIRSKDIPYFIGTPDRIITETGDILEIKTGEIFTANEWGDEGSNNIPDHYYLQVMWYMMITGKKRAQVAVKLGSATYKEYTVPYDERVADRLTVAATDFWKCVQDKREPLDADGRKFHASYLKDCKDNGTIVEIPTDMIVIAKCLIEADMKLKEAEKEKETYRRKFEALIGDNSGCEGGGYKFTWKRNKSSRKTDWEAVAQRLSKYVDGDTMKEVIDLCTEDKPGARVFRLAGKPKE